MRVTHIVVTYVCYNSAFDVLYPIVKVRPKALVHCIHGIDTVFFFVVCLS